MDTINFTTMETELKEELSSFENEIKSYKIKKYEQDAEDYRRGTVYDWTPIWKSGTQRGQKSRCRRTPKQRRDHSRPGHHRGFLLTSESDQVHPPWINVF